MAAPKDLTKSERPTTGWNTEAAPNSFDRIGDGKDGTEAFRRGYHQTEADVNLTKANPDKIRTETIDGDKLPRRGWAS